MLAGSSGPDNWCLDQSWFEDGRIYRVLHRLQYGHLLVLCPGLLARAGGGDIPLHVCSWDFPLDDTTTAGPVVMVTDLIHCSGIGPILQ